MAPRPAPPPPPPTRSGPTPAGDPGSASLSPTEFASAVTAITSAFGDPTRRAIYLHLHDHPDGLTATEVSASFDLHPNVARHHLDKLTAGGHIEACTERVPGGTGRPSKRFRAIAPDIRLDLPVRHDEVLVRLLGRALDELGSERATALAEEVGEDFGRQMAAPVGSSQGGPQSFRMALHTVADALAAHGFGAHAENVDGAMSIVTEHCPFGEAAADNPVICAVDRGMVRGMLETLTDTETAVDLRSSRGQGDDLCITDVGG